MKLSMESWFRNLVGGDIKAFDMMKEAGFEAVDYSFYWPKAGDMLAGDYAAYAHELRAYLDKINLPCTQAHAPFDLKYGEEWDLSVPAYAAIVRAMEFAAILGAEHIVVHSLSVPKGVDFMEHAVAYYKSLAPYAAQYGIKIAIENLFDRDQNRQCYTGRLETPALMYEILRRLDSPWFVVCVDVGHAALTGTAPEDMIAGLDSKVLRALHVQDNDYLADRHTLPYLGKLNWDGMTKALADIHYDGDLTLEIFAYLWNLQEEQLPAALRLAAVTGRMLMERIELAHNA